MGEQMQEITMTIYPEFEGPTEWRLQAYLFGEWAAHEVKEGDHYLQRKGMKWAVSHVSTGAIAYVAKHEDVAIKAAWRLSQLEPCNSRVIIEEGKEPRMQSPPLEWIRTSNKRFRDLDVLACVGGKLINPKDVHRGFLAAMHLKKLREQDMPPAAVDASEGKE